MLDKVENFTARPTLAQANALVERINKGRESVAKTLLAYADDNDMCDVADEALNAVGLGEFLPAKVAEVTVQVTLTVDLSNEGFGRSVDTEDFVAVAERFVDENLPSYGYSGTRYVSVDTDNATVKPHDK